MLRDREHRLRITLMEHWAGVMAWEVKRAETMISFAEERRVAAQQDAARVKPLEEQVDRLEVQAEDSRKELDRRAKKLNEREEEVQAMRTELNQRDSRISDLETALTELEAEVDKRRKNLMKIDTEATKYRVRCEELEEEMRTSDGGSAEKVQQLTRELERVEGEKKGWGEERGKLQHQVEEARSHANQFETAKISIAQALNVAKVEGVSEMLDGIKQLRTSAKNKDEELKVLKDEMREVSMGFEAEVARVGKERDTIRGKLDELNARAMGEETVRMKQAEQLEKRAQASLPSRFLSR